MSSQSVKFRIRMIAAFTAVYLIWGSTYLAIRFTIETLPVFLSAGLRFFVAGLLLYVFARFMKKDPAPPKKYWGPAFISGGLLLLGGNGSVVWAERYVPSGLAALFIAIVPLWMVLLEWWHKGKRPSSGVLVGIAVGFLGVWLLMAPGFLHFDSHNINLSGALALLLASISWSIGSVYSRNADLPSSPLLSTGMQMIAGGVLLLLLGLLQGECFTYHMINFSAKSIGALIYLVVFGSLIAFTAYIWLLKNAGVAKTSTYAFVNPVVAMFLGCVFAGERLSAQTIIAALFVLVAVIIITIYHREIEKVNV